MTELNPFDEVEELETLKGELEATRFFVLSLCPLLSELDPSGSKHFKSQLKKSIKKTHKPSGLSKTASKSFNNSLKPFVERAFD